MHEALLPLFPLPLVLFPHTPLPLHIFEERYKEMIGEAMAAESEFGVILTRSQGIVNTGCTATIDKVLEKFSDGRMDILTRGQRRFEILEVDESRDFYQARVRFLDDIDIAIPTSELRDAAIAAFRSACQATHHNPDPAPDWQEPLLSFQLAMIIPDVNFRQQLLVTRSESERLKLLAEYFPTHIQRTRHVEQLKDAAPRNGHSKHIPFSE